MTNITPQQMRELADEFATEVAAVRAHNESLGLKLSGGYVSVSLDKLTEHSAALRTAADQLEAVQGALWGGSVTTSAVVRVANAREFIPRSTSDTAPQEDRDE